MHQKSNWDTRRELMIKFIFLSKRCDATYWKYLHEEESTLYTAFGSLSHSKIGIFGLVHCECQKTRGRFGYQVNKNHAYLFSVEQIYANHTPKMTTDILFQLKCRWNGGRDGKGNEQKEGSYVSEAVCNTKMCTVGRTDIEILAHDFRYVRLSENEIQKW